MPQLHSGLSQFRSSSLAQSKAPVLAFLTAPIAGGRQGDRGETECDTLASESAQDSRCKGKVVATEWKAEGGDDMPRGQPRAAAELDSDVSGNLLGDPFQNSACQ
jgi:hypothetical protein